VRSVSQSEAFHTTRWTLICEAQGDSPEGQQALADLCAAYYAPVHAYITRTAHDLGDPRDLTQDFFARLLAGSSICGAMPRRGKFRAYLLGAVKHFLSDVRDRLAAGKRGSAHVHTPLDELSEVSLGALPAEAPASDAWFDRQWGRAVLDQALGSVAREHELNGKAREFEILKQWLVGELPTACREAAAQQLGLTQGAFKAAIHRLRVRFRDHLKAQVQHTVSTNEEFREELRYLIEVIS